MAIAQPNPAADLLPDAQIELETRIRRGQLQTVDDLRADFSAIWDDPEARLELIYSEYVLRTANGEQPRREDWFTRYPELHERLERLFGLFDLMAGDTHRPATTIGPEPSQSDSLTDNDHPAGYEILGELGRGGMSVVYRARHLELNRVVALKVLRWGDWDAANDNRLIRREAELVARLQHPNIVQVFEVGEWDGDPFLALEYLPGGTLAEALARFQRQGQTGVSTEQAVRLVGTLATAVQAAHDQGVVHRDLKPANVLLADHPTEPFANPKITDFGLAVSTELSPAITQTVTVAGTPCYMAPEQADARRALVGPRTDVYALGGILYELLTGRPPFQGATVLETLDLVRQTEPVQPRQLRPNLPRDLETICLKCLAKEPARRYESAAALADDLARFQDGKPISARPVGRVEQAWKWCKRKPMLAGMAAALVLAVSLGVAGITREYLRAERERANAVASAGGEREANALTALRLKQIELINATVFDIFAEFDVQQVRADGKPVETALAQKLIEAGRKLDANAVNDPLVLANLKHGLGQTLLSLGEPTAAISFLSASFEIRKVELGANDPDTLATMNNLGIAYQGASQPREAIAILEDAVNRCESSFGRDDRKTLHAKSSLATSYQAVNEITRAIALHDETLTRRLARYGEGDSMTLLSMNNLAGAYLDDNRVEKGMPLLQRALPLCRKHLGDNHTRTLSVMNNLGKGHQLLGQHEQALKLFEEVLTLRQSKLGPNHSATLTSLNNLATTYWNLRQVDKAIDLFEQTLARYKAIHGPHHRHTLGTMQNLGRAYSNQKQGPKATAVFLEYIAAQRKLMGADEVRFGAELLNAARSLAICNEFAAAEPLLRESLAIAQKHQPDHWRTFNTQWIVGSTLFALKKYAEAEPFLVQGYEGLKAREDTIPKSGGPEKFLPEALNMLIALYTATNKPDEVKKYTELRAKYPAPKPKEKK